MGIKRYINAYRKARASGRFLKYYAQPVDRSLILLEAGQGKNTNGNMFAFLRALNSDDRWAGYKPYVVVTAQNRASADAELRLRGIQRFHLVVRDSDEYMRVLATAGYLITDNSFPLYFIKRPEQTYLNTWHGTPLKCLGRADLDNAQSIGNVQKNFLASDYLLQPNEYTCGVMMQDYMVDRTFANKVVMSDYPRNDVLFDDGLRAAVREKYGLDGRRVVAYMPTWRGTGRTANVEDQINKSQQIVSEIAGRLGPNDILYVNFHFLIGNRIDLSEFENVRFFPKELETYEFLAACDTLISDYSSVMIDYAQTGRDVIMYMYDYEEYLADKGFYFDIRTLPFRQAYNMDEFAEILAAGPAEYTLDSRFLGNNPGRATELLLDLLVNGTAGELDIREYANLPAPHVLYVGNLEHYAAKSLTGRVLDEMPAEDRHNTVLIFEGEMKKSTLDFLKTLEPEVEFIRCVDGGAISIAEYAYLNLNRNHGLFKGKARAYVQREYDRLFRHMRYRDMQFLSSELFERAEELSLCHDTVFHCVPPYFYRRLNDSYYANPAQLNGLRGRFTRTIPYDAGYAIDLWSDELCEGIHAVFTRFRQSVSGDQLHLHGALTVRSPLPVDGIADAIELGSRIYSDVHECSFRTVPQGSSVNQGIHTYRYRFEMSAPMSDTFHWYTKNILLLNVFIQGVRFRVPVMHNRRTRLFQEQVIDLGQTGNVCEINRGLKYYRLVIREKNVTDAFGQRAKIVLAFVFHLLTPWHKPVVLYEKRCNGYEESGSVLYEKLMDAHYPNAYFILNRKYPFPEKIAPQYRRNILDQFSFRHYYNLFAAKSLIASESLDHSLETKTTSGLYKTFILDGSKNYVFLQHGVMYMVSLNAEQRVFFQKGAGKGKQRVVVSSEREAKHFTDYTNYTRNDIYVSGLLKFDRSVLEPGADRIVVMLTWRPWEFVQGTGSIRSTGYYQTLRSIVSNVPENLRQYLVVLPHPLIMNQLREDPNDEVLRYCLSGVSYDSILRKTRLLITDYSSISYDAFYRGSNIVFFWRDVADCMKEYGENARLMLTEDLAFGPVCYEATDIAAAVTASYTPEQPAEYRERYGKIVTYHDGQNTERFIRMARADNIL